MITAVFPASDPSSLPQKRPREENPTPIGLDSDLVRPMQAMSPELNTDNPKKTIPVGAVPKSYSSAAGGSSSNWLDLATSEGARGRYARVCVEIDVSKPLLGKYMIDDRTYLVEYESLDNIYFTCGFYGHKADCCPTVQQLEPELTSPEVVKEAHDAMPTGETGEWMTVQRRSRNKGKKTPPPAAGIPVTGSQFEVLKNSRAYEELVARSVEHREVNNDNVRVGANSVTSVIAAQLTEVLAKAPCMQQRADDKERPTKPTPFPRQPLADVSNKVKGASIKGLARVFDQTGIENSPELVSVPVVYENPTFQGVSQA
ncbi:hypothetical protein LINPERHAP2_LOCUS41953 [Linum perenne]